MQLKQKKSLTEALALATCSLLSQAPQNAMATATEGDWDFDVSMLNYQEADARVRVVELDINSKWQRKDDSALSFKVVSDSMTGATPSGASKVAGAQSQTSTTASGTVVASDVGEAAGKFLDPLVDFVDRRNGFVVDWENVFARTITTNLGGAYSVEDDYSSMGVNGSAGIDLNNKLTRVDVGLAWTWDTVSPSVAGGPPPEGEIVGGRLFSYDDGHKLIVDKSVGVTQVLNRRTVTKLTYVTGTTDGYLSDPYKLVTVHNDVSDLPKSYYYEKRPNTHARDALNLELMHQMAGGAVFNGYYRFFWDDWDISSHTLDMRYRIDLGASQYIQLHGRYYTQTAADFYHARLTEADERNLPEYMSADYRLDELTTTTLGIKYGFNFSQFGHFRIRYETMEQQGTTGDYTQLKAKILHAAVTVKFGR